VIASQSDQLERLVNDLMDIARISSGRVPLKMVPVAVQDAIEHALESTAPLIEKRGHKLEKRVVDQPVVVFGDLFRLARVFTNLLANAAKYTPDGGHILVALAHEGRNAVVRVQDDGIGIRAEDLDGLYGLFARGAADGAPIQASADGLGVGLALARQLVAQHGGMLEGRSAGLGQGSEFVVTLPVCSEPEVAASTAPEVPVKPPFRARRILVVDDNLIVTAAFKVLLQSMGHSVRTLSDGTKVVPMIREFAPEVVFLDISMPAPDGFQVAADIRAAGLDTQPLLVALTGHGQASDREATRKAGFDLHLVKPVGAGRIEALLAGLDD
jgi:CheY-like chemotaxis protein